MMDKNTNKRLSFVYLLVVVKVGIKLPEEMNVKNKKGRFIVNKVTYD